MNILFQTESSSTLQHLGSSRRCPLFVEYPRPTFQRQLLSSPLRTPSSSQSAAPNFLRSPSMPLPMQQPHDSGHLSTQLMHDLGIPDADALGLSTQSCMPQEIDALDALGLPEPFVESWLAEHGLCRGNFMWLSPERPSSPKNENHYLYDMLDSLKESHDDFLRQGFSSPVLEV